MTRDQKLIVVVAVMASLLEIIDTSIVNVAIPTMMGNLGATLEDISMVVTGYAIANAIILPLSSWLSGRFGRRTYFLGCIIAFTITSVACGLAPNLATLIVFRILQGLFGGALLPTSQALIYEQFPKEKAGIAGAIFGMSVMIGPTLGPTMGGYLTDHFGWRMIFNINLPLGLIALFIGLMVIKDADHEVQSRAAGPAQKVDLIGLGLLAVGIGSLQYVLERGEANDWFSSSSIVIGLILAIVSLPTFVIWELKIPNPILNIRLFKDGIVTNGVLLMANLGFFLYSVIFLLPVLVSRTLHLSATQTGMLFIPGSLLTAFMMPVVGRAMQKVEAKVLIFFGMCVIEVFAFSMTKFSGQSSYGEIISALYIRGLAMAFLFVPINSSILSQFKGAALGQVSGLLNLSRQIGGSIGIAMVSTLLSVRAHQALQDLSNNFTLLNPNVQLAIQQASNAMATKMVSQVGSASPAQAAIRFMAMRLNQQAFVISVVQLIYIIGFIFALGFIPLKLLKLRSRPAAVADSH